MALACSAARRLGESAPRWPSGSPPQWHRPRMRGCVRTRLGGRIAKPRWRWVRIGHAKRTALEMRLRKKLFTKTIGDLGCGTTPPGRRQQHHILTLHRALRRMAGLVFLLVFWMLAGACQRHGVGGFLLCNTTTTIYAKPNHNTRTTRGMAFFSTKRNQAASRRRVAPSNFFKEQVASCSLATRQADAGRKSRRSAAPQREAEPAAGLASRASGRPPFVSSSSFSSSS